jgi:ATP-dependent Clp protease ATP-binding subunit ClpX
LESRRGEFQKTFGKWLEGAALEAVVDAAIRQGISAETMYERYIKVQDEILSFEKEFQSLYNLRIRFADDALHELAKLVLNGSEEALIVCRKIFQNYHHGLKLVMERSGGHEFTIPKEAIQNPERFLNDMIQKTYSR